jgi:hypothetical protein
MMAFLEACTPGVQYIGRAFVPTRGVFVVVVVVVVIV